MSLQYCEEILAEADAVAANGTQRDMFEVLQTLPFGDYCDLYLDPPARYKNLVAKMPSLPSNEVQKKWMGHFGRDMMIQSSNITRLFQVLYTQATGNTLRGRKILDYGCGWGRLLRMMYHVSDVNHVYGIDPMTASLAECRKYGITENLALCDAVPEDLPFEGTLFDLIFSFSVFTHISERSMEAVLKAARRRIGADGVYIITIRPIEFWNLREDAWGSDVVSKLRQDHLNTGFAFYCSGSVDERLGQDYGDSSMSFDYLRTLAAKTGWTVGSIDRDLIQPLQTMVTLRPSE